MRNILTVGIIALLMTACTQVPKNEFTLKGNITGETPEMVYLQVYEAGEMKVLDSANVVNGAFEFKGVITEPDFQYIRVGNERNLLGLFVESAVIEVSGNVDSLKNATITGSKTQDQFAAYNESKAVYENQLKELYMQYKSAENEEAQALVEAKYDSINAVKATFVKQYITENSNSILAPYIVRNELIHQIELAELEQITTGFSPDLKENKYTKILTERIEILKTVEPGMPAPEFTQNDTLGNPVNLADFKGKYLLIDFWASWCVPCRQANPTIVSVYNKYADKNFTILGISMDKSRDKWIEAVKADGLTWNHVSTLEGWANPVGKIYGVNSIPHAVLIGPDGIIIKRGVHPDELDEILAGLIK